MSTFGTTQTSTGGRGVRASADGNPRWKVAGVTIDWATVTAVGSDTTLADGRVVKSGDKFLRYGQVVTKITASGKFGPYASGAVDGRQTLARGDCFIVNETVVMSDLNSDHPGVFDGGRVFVARVTDVAGAPTLANLDTAFPAVTWVRD